MSGLKGDKVHHYGLGSNDIMVSFSEPSGNPDWDLDWEAAVTNNTDTTVEDNILDGLWNFIETLRSVYPRDTYGYNFLVGKTPKKVLSAGTYKRYMMYLRWMVRKDSLDMGLWSKIDKKDLLMPLDTHTFNVSRRLGLLKRKSYDMKASIELTDTLRSFDVNDPVKYDFALYRLGQEHLA